MAVGLAAGVSASMIITMSAAALCAHLILAEKMKPDAIGYCAMIVLAMASAVGAWLSAGLIKHRWLPVCIGAGGIYYLVLVLITVLFFGGQFQGMFVTALMVLAGCGSVGLLGLKRRKKARFR